MVKINILTKKEYMKLIKEFNINPWYMKYLGLVPRGFSSYTCNEIYINDDAFYINKRDMDLLIQHEIYYIEGYGHTLTGVMSPIGIIRWLTT